MSWDRDRLRKPTGALDEAGPAFARICPFSPRAANEDVIAAERFPSASAHDVRLGRFEATYVGNADAATRSLGSSGGMVSWVATELLRRGEIDGVAHVVPTGGEDGVFFRYAISRTPGEVSAGAKSRYFPIDLAEVLAEIRATPGRYAIVGIPCFIKAVNLLRAEDPVIAERVTHLLGLFCGHMKSGRFVDSFAWQLGVDPKAVRAVDYRRKDEGRPANWYTAQLTLADGQVHARDWWHLADGDWGAGFFQASACNFCDDVVAETADISFGDAWVEPYSSDGRGTNVVVVRSRGLRDLLAEGISREALALTEVDADFVAGTQDAGLRHRREGLAYRLTWRSRGIVPVKRVHPSAAGLGWRRRCVYRMRAGIARWSHPVARLAAFTRPEVYVSWARASLALYQGLTYGRGWAGRMADGLERVLRTRALRNQKR